MAGARIKKAIRQDFFENTLARWAQAGQDGATYLMTTDSNPAVKQRNGRNRWATPWRTVVLMAARH
jgi:hypothetical protein